MAREKLAEIIRWPRIIWLVGIVNPCFMLPQLTSVWTSGLTEGISVLTLSLLTAIQTGFALHGFFLRDCPLLWSNGAAAMVTLITMLSVLYFRQLA
ncbi:hypothetical protein A3I27_04385 [Candidatus Giovannonibacteria bacterium RIFCSPLOWO2_02_FULL_43_11b]|uniref:Uncharacterized protein n=1 Tax=Candidatus Giovannonibacteria bacterium RIFCSPHIGHO2_12_FULL_43_15 TaxID=1798341 RepID=A0A1F5WPA2_9BACT|nr:MAG: hypothetical protein A2739_00745 [Candidatus Giovannonibacteria bacterium RIFCSPHIGHO2_01_FULL_43_100]OGF66726.1 MAG: hypothetical protein A3B97_02325 [Candidatus Giovannonibacteria bacterium RIFCSPHIGHO2_02_FULL_43_32]OGF77502.1 MAG: hypothetical protein A3F23_00820 [Candidatus Giovannonibacteria bacterium RIFCSPHIGHO2_12_FULL_43_15]OGF78873.1 MAG: hypothetical protein A3A15_00220 [Candidatus Giovannonibacteria bacterium RIFCSPLOWO2_01_FULL_43_60]OGF89946.1 MAG: hypothetical protein A3